MMRKLLTTKMAALSLAIVLVFSSGCTTGKGLESYNRSMYQFNKTLDEYTLKPVAKAYKAVTPDVVEHRVSNFFDNIAEIGTLVNSILQGKLHNAAVSASRIAWNSTVGIGGLFDVATSFNLKSKPEDFGQTLRTWGLPAGPYIVLPFFGPSTLTDAIGKAGDFAISPYTHYNWDSNSTRNGVVGMRYVNDRVQLLSLSNMLNNASTDEYLFVKNAYLQKRNADTQNQSQAEQANEAFDDSFFAEALEDQ